MSRFYNTVPKPVVSGSCPNKVVSGYEESATKGKDEEKRLRVVWLLFPHGHALGVLNCMQLMRTQKRAHAWCQLTATVNEHVLYRYQSKM